MNSSANDDEFADNPFRSGGDDFFDTQPQQTAPPPQQQQQQQQFTNVQQPPQQQFQPQPDQFQNNFPPPQQQARQPVNNMNMAGGGLSGPMDSNNQGLNQPQAPTSRLGACMMCLSLDSYRAYFDIDAEDIVIRIKSAVLDCYKPEHFRNNVVGVNKTDSLKGPDLYGPFWITMTLIFFVAVSLRLSVIGCLFYMSDDDPFCLNPLFYSYVCLSISQVTGNVHAYLHHSAEDEFEYDINHLLHAAWILSSFSFGVPTLLWVTTQCLGMQPLLLAEWVCIYGYSLAVYLPVVMLCVIPLGLVSFILLLGATLVSGSLVIRNVTAPLLSTDASGKALPLVFLIMGMHTIFFLLMKYQFFHKKSLV